MLFVTFSFSSAASFSRSSSCLLVSFYSVFYLIYFTVFFLCFIRLTVFSLIYRNRNVYDFRNITNFVLRNPLILQHSHLHRQTHPVLSLIMSMFVRANPNGLNENDENGLHTLKAVFKHYRFITLLFLDSHARLAQTGARKNVIQIKALFLFVCLFRVFS